MYSSYMTSGAAFTYQFNMGISVQILTIGWYLASRLHNKYDCQLPGRMMLQYIFFYFPRLERTDCIPFRLCCSLLFFIVLIVIKILALGILHHLCCRSCRQEHTGQCHICANILPPNPKALRAALYSTWQTACKNILFKNGCNVAWKRKGRRIAHLILASVSLILVLASLITF